MILDSLHLLYISTLTLHMLYDKEYALKLKSCLLLFYFVGFLHGL